MHWRWCIGAVTNTRIGSTRHHLSSSLSLPLSLSLSLSSTYAATNAWVTLWAAPSGWCHGWSSGATRIGPLLPWRASPSSTAFGCVSTRRYRCSIAAQPQKLRKRRSERRWEGRDTMGGKAKRRMTGNGKSESGDGSGRRDPNPGSDGGARAKARRQDPQTVIRRSTRSTQWSKPTNQSCQF